MPSLSPRGSRCVRSSRSSDAAARITARDISSPGRAWTSPRRSCGLSAGRCRESVSRHPFPTATFPMDGARRVADTTGATLLADRQGVVRMASAAAGRLLGCAPSDVEGCRLDEVLEAPDRAVLEAALSSVLGAVVDHPVRLAVSVRVGGGHALEADLLLTPVAATSAPVAVLIEIRPLGPPRPYSLGAPGAEGIEPAVMAQAATADAVAICRDEVIIEDLEGLAALTRVVPRRVEGVSIK